MSNVLVDQTQDTNFAVLYQLAELGLVPDRVAKASFDKLAAADDLPAGVFADPRHRQFPLHTPEATLASAAYYYSQRDHGNIDPHDSINFNLAKAAKVHGCLEELVQLDMTHRRVHKLASELPDEDEEVYAFVGADGKKHLPITDPEKLAMAEAWLVEHAKSAMTTHERRKIAQACVKQAADLGVRVTDMTRKYAGVGLPDVKGVRDMLVTRRELARKIEPTCVERFDKMARHVEALLADEESRQQVVDVIGDFDFRHQLQHNQGASQPESVVYAIDPNAPKVAAFESGIRRPDGEWVEKDVLEKLPVEPFGQVLGTSFAESISNPLGRVDAVKLASVLPSLDYDQTEVVYDTMHFLGVEVGAVPTPNLSELSN